MRFEIDYPNDREIQEQMDIVKERAFSKMMHRPPLRVVFFRCKLSAAISLALYFCLIFVCASVRPESITGGFLALAVFPLTYFCFYFFSILSEEQSEVTELKQSFRYSFGYLVSLRMLYASLVAIGLNMALLLLLYREVRNFWSIGAAGTTSMLLLALVTLKSFEKSNSVRVSSVVVALWVLCCFVLMRFGKPLYHLFIEVIPLGIHIGISFICFLAFLAYIRKVEKQNAYGF